MTSDNAYHGDVGDYFARLAGDSPYNAFTDRPAMLELAGEVAGLRLLDVGCGAGNYAAELLDRGARVMGIDGSATLLGHARDRVGDRAELRLHDLDTPLDFAADAAFDGAVCALVYHHIRERARLLAELRRVLRPGGWLVLSTSHPTSDWRHHGGSYYDESWVDFRLPDPSITVHLQRLTLETLVNEWLSAGFTLERLVEPRPLPRLREIDADRYERLTREPSFLAVRLRRPPGDS
ncbi:class I SAM-dependent methyltransferase [Streptomyces litchfieldiae]|uniref:Methyltransferase domain-containing protein n=1 Tax=Streptomyces litchfieldiae TaxID=3075543 RepID=A0ABU2MPD8_9ACTN|nr:methyltransferase domain-containing protein [Streptomyces sp. DSM 44938]MDT0343488.1 methyltransferase domain-containing protein [Streptomyces sp. DSM 44938]